MKSKRIIIRYLLICLFMLSFGVSAGAESTQKVYVIPVKETIEPGLAKFVERSYKEAEKLRVDMVILEVDTPGGRMDSAMDIKEAIENASVPTTAFVKGGAISAGAYITLACPKIAMVPGATMGDAEPRNGDVRADEKIISPWAAEMGASAEKNGRNREIAMSMADRDIAIPNVKEKGKLLTLTYKEAQKLGFTDFIVNDREELIKVLNLKGAEVMEAKLSAAEKLARIVTNPFVAPLFLTIGIAGIIIEIFTVGWGIAYHRDTIARSLFWRSSYGRIHKLGVGFIIPFGDNFTGS
jgi:membrane-bound serine protease (ClpP class)